MPGLVEIFTYFNADELIERKGQLSSVTCSGLSDLEGGRVRIRKGVRTPHMRSISFSKR